jgi:hypothetical protein
MMKCHQFLGIRGELEGQNVLLIHGPGHVDDDVLAGSELLMTGSCEACICGKTKHTQKTKTCGLEMGGKKASKHLANLFAEITGGDPQVILKSIRETSKNLESEKER